MGKGPKTRSGTQETLTKCDSFLKKLTTVAPQLILKNREQFVLFPLLFLFLFDFFFYSSPPLFLSSIPFLSSSPSFFPYDLN